jgi:hypothetical protein
LSFNNLYQLTVSNEVTEVITPEEHESLLIPLDPDGFVVGLVALELGPVAPDVALLALQHQDRTGKL